MRSSCLVKYVTESLRLPDIRTKTKTRYAFEPRERGVRKRGENPRERARKRERCRGRKSEIQKLSIAENFSESQGTLRDFQSPREREREHTVDTRRLLISPESSSARAERSLNHKLKLTSRKISRNLYGGRQ